MSESLIENAAPTLPGMDAEMEAQAEAQLRGELARRIFESRQEAGPWMEDYYDLLDEGWSWRQAVYILWASQPKDRRRPGTQWELATEVLGLTSDRAIRDWKANNPGMELRISEVAASALSKARADIYAALIASASKATYRNHQDRKLALEMLGDYVPRQTVSVGPIVDAEDIEGASTEDLAALAQMPTGEIAREDTEGDAGGTPALHDNGEA